MMIHCIIWLQNVTYTDIFIRRIAVSFTLDVFCISILRSVTLKHKHIKKFKYYLYNFDYTES